MCWAPADRQLLMRQDISPTELRVLLYLMTYDYTNGDGERKGTVFVGIGTIQKDLGMSRAWVFNSVLSLESKGLLTRHQNPGKRSAVVFGLEAFPKNWDKHLTPVASGTRPLQQTRLVEETPPVEQTRPLQQTDPSTVVDSTRPVEWTRNTVLKYKKGNIFEEGTPLASLATPTQAEPVKQSTPRKAKMPKYIEPPSLELADKSIYDLDLEKFKAKYPEVDVAIQHELFANHWLGANLPNGKPAWTKHHDWNRAFHTWCRKSLTFGKPKPPPDSLPRLPNGEIDRGKLTWNQLRDLEGI
jgi:hypothetical protein